MSYVISTCVISRSVIWAQVDPDGAKSKQRSRKTCHVKEPNTPPAHALRASFFTSKTPLARSLCWSCFVLNEKSFTCEAL